jgi:hypothetical protein
MAKSMVRWTLFGAGLVLTLVLAQAGSGESERDVGRAEPNFYLDISREFVEDAVERATDRVDPVRDVILGTRIRGTGRTLARTQVQLVPSDGRAAIDLVTRGTTYTDTVGVNGKVRLYNNSTIPFEIRKRVLVNADGVYATRSSAHATSRSHLNGLSTSYPLFINRFARQIAYRKYQQRRSQADYIAARHAEDRLNRRAEVETHPRLADAAHSLQEKLDEIDNKGVPLQRLRFGTVEHALYVRGTVLSPKEPVTASEVPPLRSWCYAGVRVHESAVNHTMMDTVAGKTYSGDELEKEASRLLGPLGKSQPEADDKEWTITFTKEKPVVVKFADQGARVQIRLAEFTSGDNEYSGMDVGVAYKFQPRGNTVVAVRQGNIEAFPPGFKPGQKLSGRQQAMRTVLQRRFGKIFEKEVVLRERDFRNVGPLVANHAETDRGWLTVTLDRASPAAPVQTARYE